MAATPPDTAEKIDSLLARNLVAARCAMAWTQDALSAASGISRATIAQLESGYSDPRLSTIEALANAFGLTPALMLFGGPEIKSIAASYRQGRPDSELTTSQVLRQLEFQLESKALKDTARAAERIKELLQSNPALNPASVLLGSIFGAMRPDPGVAVGTSLGLVFEIAERR